jgi:hypothetical protein
MARAGARRKRAPSMREAERPTPEAPLAPPEAPPGAGLGAGLTGGRLLPAEPPGSSSVGVRTVAVDEAAELPEPTGTSDVPKRR